MKVLSLQNGKIKFHSVPLYFAQELFVKNNPKQFTHPNLHGNFLPSSYLKFNKNFLNQNFYSSKDYQDSFLYGLRGHIPVKKCKHTYLKEMVKRLHIQYGFSTRCGDCGKIVTIHIGRK